MNEQKKKRYSLQRIQWNQRPKCGDNRTFAGGNISSVGARDACCSKWNVWIGWVKLKTATCNMKSLAYLRGNIQLWSWGQPSKFCPLRSSLWSARWWGRVWIWEDFLIGQTLGMRERGMQKMPGCSEPTEVVPGARDWDGSAEGGICL